MFFHSRTIASRIFVVALAFLGSHALSQTYSVSARPNQTQYVSGDTLRIAFTTRTTIPTTIVIPDLLDLYVGIIYADQRTVMFFSSLSPPAWKGADLRTSASNFVPLYKNLQLKTGEWALPGPLELKIPATIPPGTYAVLFAETRAGTLADGTVDASDLVTYAKVPLVVAAAPAAPTASTYTPYKALSAQSLATGSLYITGSATVKATALEEARRQLDTMLRHRPDVIARLRSSGSLIGVFAPPTEDVCSLPYFSDLRSLPIASCDAKGGLGGVPGREASGCSEYNLLKNPLDAFGRGQTWGENVCLHEIAHLIMNVGLTDADRARIQTQYERAKASGIWGSDYIMVNDDEYFAESTQAYFCANPGTPNAQHRSNVNCPFELQTFDPLTYELIDSIFIESSDLR
jgi:hypothetical protein